VQSEKRKKRPLPFALWGEMPDPIGARHFEEKRKGKRKSTQPRDAWGKKRMLTEPSGKGKQSM